MCIGGMFSTIKATICHKSTICYNSRYKVYLPTVKYRSVQWSNKYVLYKCNRLQHGHHQALRTIFSNVLLQNCESALLFLSIFKLVFIPVSNIEMTINLSSNYNEIWFKPKIYCNFIPFYCNHYYLNEQK